MNIEIASLCDAATEQNGKLNILGTFDTIFAREFPVIIPQCSVAYRIRFPRSEFGRHQLKVNFIDEDGQPYIPPLTPTIDVNAADDQEFSVINVVLNMRDLQFRAAGRFQIDLLFQDQPAISIPLWIRPAK
jgi:hypothetical protein